MARVAEYRSWIDHGLDRGDDALFEQWGVGQPTLGVERPEAVLSAVAAVVAGDDFVDCGADPGCSLRRRSSGGVREQRIEMEPAVADMTEVADDRLGSHGADGGDSFGTRRHQRVSRSGDVMSENHAERSHAVAHPVPEPPPGLGMDEDAVRQEPSLERRCDVGFQPVEGSLRCA